MRKDRKAVLLTTDSSTSCEQRPQILKFSSWIDILTQDLGFLPDAQKKVREVFSDEVCKQNLTNFFDAKQCEIDLLSRARIQNMNDRFD